MESKNFAPFYFPESLFGPSAETDTKISMAMNTKMLLSYHSSSLLLILKLDLKKFLEEVQK